jgi:hypothetical protein
LADNGRGKGQREGEEAGKSQSFHDQGGFRVTRGARLL